MYQTLVRSWSALSRAYPGWSLSEIKSLSPRERMNYMRMAVEAQGGYRGD